MTSSGHLTLDIRSSYETFNCLYDVYSSATDADGEIIDLFTLQGIEFSVFSGDVDADYTFALFESDNSDMSDSTEIVDGDIRLYGTLADLTLSASQTQGDQLNTLAVMNTKRYLQLVGTSTGTSGTVSAFYRVITGLSPTMSE